MMNDYGKSDNSIVPKKLPNKTGKPGAEAMEERELAKGNPLKRNAPRTQGRIHAQSALKRIRRAAGKNRRQRLTALFHHVYDVDQLREAYYAVKRTAAAGIDGWTWHEYGKSLEENLQDLSHR